MFEPQTQAARLKARRSEPFHHCITLHKGAQRLSLGWIAPHHMPAHGLAYLVIERKENSKQTKANQDHKPRSLFSQIKRQNTSHADKYHYEVFGYVDKSGRLFPGNQLLYAPPACTPLLYLEKNPLYPHKAKIVAPLQHLASQLLYEERDILRAQGLPVQEHNFAGLGPQQLEPNGHTQRKLADLEMQKPQASPLSNNYKLISPLVEMLYAKQVCELGEEYQSLPSALLLSYLALIPDLQSLLLAQLTDAEEPEISRVFQLIQQLKEEQSIDRAVQRIRGFVSSCEQQLKENAQPNPLLKEQDLYFLRLIQEYELTKNPLRTEDPGQPDFGSAAELEIQIGEKELSLGVMPLPSGLRQALDSIFSSHPQSQAGFSATQPDPHTDKPRGSANTSEQKSSPQPPINLQAIAIDARQLPPELRKELQAFLEQVGTGESGLIGNPQELSSQQERELSKLISQAKQLAGQGAQGPNEDTMGSHNTQATQGSQVPQYPIGSLPFNLQDLFSLQSGLIQGERDRFRISLTNSEHNHLYSCRLSREAYSNAKVLIWADKLECALNRLVLAMLETKRNSSQEELSLADWKRWLHISRLAPQFSAQVKDTILQNNEHWNCRYLLSKALRSLGLPHRIEYQYRLDASLSRGYIALWCPPLAVVGSSRYLDQHQIWWTLSETERNIMQTHYCAQLSALVAACFFKQVPYAEELFIQLQSFEEDFGTVSIGLLHIRRDELKRSDFKRLNTGLNHQEFFKKFGVSTILSENILTINEERLDASEPPFDTSLDYFAQLYNPNWDPNRFGSLLETNIPPNYQQPLRATILRDLARDSFIESSLEELNLKDLAFKSTHELVTELLKLDTMDDPYLEALKEELISGLIDGNLSFTHSQELEDYLITGGQLNRAFEHALNHFKEGAVEKTIDILAGELALLEQKGLLIDDAARVYRSFDSVSELILYKDAHPEDRRRICPVNKTVINAYHLVSTAYAQLGEYERALDCAHRALELSPYADSINIHISQIYLSQKKMLAVRRHAIRILEESINPVLLSLAYANLAIDFGGQGMQEEAMACSALAQSFRGATDKLPEFVTQDPKLLAHKHHFSSRRQAELVLEKQGIPIAPNKHHLQVIRDAAQAAVSCLLYPVAAELIKSLIDLDEEDFLSEILESVNLTEG